jgi:Protein of unknown function (DUF3999)
VERVDLEFADPTDAAHVTVRSRPDLSAEWRTRHAGLFYSLAEANNRITSSPARIGRAEDRYWAVETTRDGGWRPGLAPRLKLGWYPHELLFLAQGDGPFTLAYGSARVRAADAAVEGVLTRLDEESRSRIRNATLAVPHDLGGSAALDAALPWRQVFLWVFLVGAVLALGVFALRLFRTPAAGS